MSDYPDLVEETEITTAEPPDELAPPPPSRPDTQPHLDFLVSEGYRPEVDEDGDLRFRHEGRTHFLIPQEKDPGYFRVSFPGAWECDGPEEEALALRTVNAVNRDLKVAKCVLVDGVVWVSVEGFFDPPDSFRPVFARCLDVIGSAAWQIRERMRASAGS